MAVYDDTAAIGKLYRRQDEIGRRGASRWRSRFLLAARAATGA